MNTKAAILAPQTRLMLDQAEAMTAGQGPDWLGNFLKKHGLRPIVQAWLNDEGLRKVGDTVRLPCRLLEGSSFTMPSCKRQPTACQHRREVAIAARSTAQDTAQDTTWDAGRVATQDTARFATWIAAHVAGRIAAGVLTRKTAGDSGRISTQVAAIDAAGNAVRVAAGNTVRHSAQDTARTAAQDAAQGTAQGTARGAAHWGGSLRDLHDSASRSAIKGGSETNSW